MKRYATAEDFARWEEKAQMNYDRSWEEVAPQPVPKKIIRVGKRVVKV